MAPRHVCFILGTIRFFHRRISTTELGSRLKNSSCDLSQCLLILGFVTLDADSMCWVLRSRFKPDPKPAPSIAISVCGCLSQTSFAEGDLSQRKNNGYFRGLLKALPIQISH